MPPFKMFAVAILAKRREGEKFDPTIYCVACVCMACDQGEAKLKGGVCCTEKWPEAQGYYGHSVSAEEFSDDFLASAGLALVPIHGAGSTQH